MKLPKSVTVGGFKFKVESVAEIDVADSEGECDINDCTIKIKTGLGEREYQRFLHEVVHAITSVYCNDSISEENVESLSQGLFQVAKDLRWIGD